METRLLEYFLTVAREKNITKGAQALHITQPTLSRQLVQLEEEIGKPLIIRSKKGIELTEAGMIFRRRAEEILDLIEKSQEEVQTTDELRGRVSIGYGECNASYDLMPKIINEFRKLYPLVTYELYTGEASLIKEKINQGLIDIGILLEPIEIEEFDFFRLPVIDKWGVVSGYDHPLAYKKTIESKDLIGIPLFFNQRRTIIQSELESWAKGDYEKYQFVASYNLISNIIPFLKMNAGCAISIESVVQFHSHDIKFTPLSPSIISSTVLVTKKHQVLSPVTKKFIQFVEDYIKE